MQRQKPGLRSKAGQIHGTGKQGRPDVKLTRGQVLAALPTVPKADLQAIGAAVALLMGGGTPEAPQTSTATPSDLWVFDALMFILDRGSMGYVTFSKMQAHKTFVKNAPEVLRWLNTYFPYWADKSLYGKYFLRHLMLQLSVYLKFQKLNPTIGIMCANLIHLPEAFNDAYPGYLASGMGKTIYDQVTRIRE